MNLFPFTYATHTRKHIHPQNKDNYKKLNRVTACFVRQQRLVLFMTVIVRLKARSVYFMGTKVKRNLMIKTGIGRIIDHR